MTLSDRLRPGSECAPWVIDEVRKLERIQAELADALQWIADCRTGGLIEGKARAALAKVEATR